MRASAWRAWWRDARKCARRLSIELAAEVAQTMAWCDEPKEILDELTPPDFVSQIMLALPMIVLYLLGVGVAWLFGQRRVGR